MAHTNRHLARNLGIALLLAATLLAALFLATQSPPGPASVQAHPCGPTVAPSIPEHDDFQRTAAGCSETGHQPVHRHVIEVDGGRTRNLEFRAHPPLDGDDRNLDQGSVVKIRLQDFNFPAEFKTAASHYKLKSSATAAMATGPQSVALTNKTIALTIGVDGISVGANEHLIITIDADAGIVTPETPRGFDKPEEGYEVTIDIEDSRDSIDKNFVVVKNPISSTVPNTTVRVDLATHTEVDISSSEDIEVDFSGPSADSEFTIPTTITNTRVTIRPSVGTSFAPSDVLVQDAKVTLTVPEGKAVTRGDYTISFSQLARIKTPFSAGNRLIKVKSFVPGDQIDEIIAVIERTTAVSPLSGTRDSEFTLEGKGYAAGTVTVFDGEDDQIDPGETLDSVKTLRGAFRVKLKVRSRNDEGKYTVWTRDSEGTTRSVDFTVRNSMSFEPETVTIGSNVRITISDWEPADDGGHREVAAVHIGGMEAYVTSVRRHGACYEYVGEYGPDDDRVISFEITVPAGVPAGEQTVSIFDHTDLSLFDTEDKADESKIADPSPCEQSPAGQGEVVFAEVIDGATPIAKSTVEIEGRSLTLSPTTAVRGQRVTVSGFGFGRGGNLTSVSINGEPVDERPEQFEVSTTGFISITVTVPPNTPVGANEVRVTGANNTLGTGTLTVPEPTVTVSPSESRAGTEVTATGTGFIANTPVRVTYDDTHVAAGFADASGNVSLPFRVPLSAQIGLSYQVTVQAEVSGTEVAASATHSPALSTIATEPAEVSVGDLLTITGRDLPPFAIVRPIEIDGRNVTPFPAPTTDATGAFEVEVRVPGTPVGDQPLRVVAGGVVLTHTITVVPLPLSGPPARVFRDLINEGSLIAVWRYVNESQQWNLFDPNVPEELSELNDLTYVGTGDIVWLETLARVEFQGDILNAGWSLIRLK